MPSCLQQWYSNYIPATATHERPFLQSTSNTEYVPLPFPPVFVDLIGDKQYPITASICIFLTTCKHAHLLMIYWHFFFCENPFHILAHFSTRLFAYLCLLDLYTRFIYGLLFRCLLFMWQIFSPSLSLVFRLYVLLHHFNDTFMWWNLSVAIESWIFQRYILFLQDDIFLRILLLFHLLCLVL